MTLYIDIGNSNIKIYKTEKKLDVLLNTKDNKVIESMKKYLKKDNYFIISSVETTTTNILKEYFITNKIKYYYFTNEDYSYFFEGYNINLDGLGVDRAINIIALQNKYPKAIIFDYGTALTVDVVSLKKYETGFIFPGIEAMKESLVKNTSLLEDFEFFKVVEEPLLSTDSQINSAIILGSIGAMNSFLMEISTIINIKDYKVVLTGGTYKYLFKNIGKDKFSKFFTWKFEKIDNLNYLGLKEVEKIIKDKLC